MAAEPRAVAEDLALEPVGEAAWEASAGRGSGRAFGGLLVALALRAAALTVDDDRPAHSVHASFVRPGSLTERLRIEVEVTRNGSAFAARRVVLSQSKGAVLVATTSFQADEPGPEYDTRPPELPDPEGLGHGRYDSGWFESRDVPSKHAGSAPYARSAWFRPRLPVPAELGHCALALLSDFGATRSLRQPHMRSHDTSRRQSVSLDHAVWFHHPAPPVDGWLRYELVPLATAGGRGLALGRIRAADGLLLATVTQEALLRMPPR